MIRAGIALVLACLLGGCTPQLLGITIEEPPPPPPPPWVPRPLQGEAAPELEPTGQPGLSRAAETPGLYYYEPDDLWYRRARHTWFQAFTWDGHWFPPERVPGVLEQLESSPAPP